MLSRFDSLIFDLHFRLIILVQGRLLAGLGKTLRLYDIGKARLLRKAENVNFHSPIVTLHSSADRVYAQTLVRHLYIYFSNTQAASL